jgi:hypothetical protein
MTDELGGLGGHGGRKRGTAKVRHVNIELISKLCCHNLFTVRRGLMINASVSIQK